MERHFLLPVTIAAALHGGLLLVIRRGPVPEPVPSVIQWVVGEKPALLMPPESLPEELVTFDSRPAKGSPLEAPPVGVDNSTVTVDVRDFVIERSPTPTVPGPNRPTIPTGPIGVPEGTDDGIRHGKGSIIGAAYLDNPPRTRAQPAPQYPFDAKSRGVEGEVMVEFTVDENGQVVDARIVSSTDRIFDEPTLRAVAKWRFEPGKRSGRPVRFKMVLPMKFSLNP